MISAQNNRKGQDQIALAARSDALPQLISWLTSTPVLQDVETGVLRHIEMAAEEVFLNVARHGRADGEGDAVIALRHSGPQIVLSISDDGAAFNPLDAPEPDVDASLEDREVGGLGLHLLRRISDRQEYARVDDRNTLQIFFTYVASPDLGGSSGEVGKSPIARTLRAPFFSIFLPLVVVFTAGLLLAALLTALKLESAYMHVQQAQHDILAREVKGTIERSFGAGLSLRSNRSIQVALDRNAQQHDGEVALFVADLDGSIAYQSAGALQAPDIAASTSLVHQLVTERFLTTVPLNVNNVAIGTLAIAFSAETALKEASALKSQLFAAAGLAALLAVPLLGLLVFAALALMDRRAGRLADAMRDLALGQDAGITISRAPLLTHARTLANAIPRSASDPGGHD